VFKPASVLSPGGFMGYAVGDRVFVVSLLQQRTCPCGVQMHCTMLQLIRSVAWPPIMCEQTPTYPCTLPVQVSPCRTGHLASSDVYLQTPRPCCAACPAELKSCVMNHSHPQRRPPSPPYPTGPDSRVGAPAGAPHLCNLTCCE